MTISHVDQHNKPTMVDISGKAITYRTAEAQSVVEFPPEIFAELQHKKLYAKKGPIVDTAIIAGVMAAKRTHELIPFCHPIPIDGCTISIAESNEHNTLTITAKVNVTHKTGVEMEALTAASIAALTIYDMCKALSQKIVIRDTRLVRKTGGKSDVMPS